MSQMNSMWKNMDDLAESDPDAYKKFTSDVLAEGPPDKGGQPRTFLPTPAFVVKVKTVTSDSAKLFVNMTSCEALEPPKDHLGRPIEKHDRRGADGLQIPLLVGEVRPCPSPDDDGDNSARAVDAVFHPWIIERCEADNTFKAQVIDLALGWVEQETDTLKLTKQWKTIRSKYKGGLGDAGDTPVPFPVDRAMMQVQHFMLSCSLSSCQTCLMPSLVTPERPC